MAPPVPWPGSPGGADSPSWGDTIRLYVWVALHAGSPMRWGSVAGTGDALTAGNVWSSGVPAPPVAPPTNRLWIDVTCDTLAVETHLGGTRADGALVRADAATARITLADPTRQYDPTNPDSPWQFQGRSRLMPGTPVIVFAETVDPLTREGEAVRHNLFTGTVDTWSAPWEPHPEDRRASIVASDDVKTLVGLDRGEQPAEGAGDTVTQRIERVLGFYGWTGPRRLDASTTTEVATLFASSAWELIGAAVDDEIGFVYIDTNGVLQFHNRATWSTTPTPALTIGCSPNVANESDTIIDVTVTTTDAGLRNAVYASRPSSPVQAARSQASIDQFGEHGLKKTDLGVTDDAQAGAWAEFIVLRQGWPRARITDVTMRPALDPARWPAVLELRLVADRVRVVWTPPGSTTTYNIAARVIGVDHTIDRHVWETDLALIYGDVFARVFTWGPAETDRLDVGNVYQTGG